MKRCLVLGCSLIAVMMMTAPAYPVCGDINGDTQIDINDLVYFINYLWRGGPPPAVYADADVDDHLVVTTVDFMVLENSAYLGGTLHCPPTQGKLTGPVSPNNILAANTYSYPAGATSLTLQLIFTGTTPFVCLDLPLTIDVGGQAPTIGTITFDPVITAWANLGATYGTAGPGRVLLSLGNFTYAPVGPLTNQVIATVDISLSSPPTSNQPINLNWDTNCPPVHSTYGSSHYPLLVVSYPKSFQRAVECYEPTLKRNSNPVPGLTTWGMLILAALMATTGVWLVLRRKRAIA